MPALPPNRPGCPAARRSRPLPDPAAVRLCLIPDPAPPFDIPDLARPLDIPDPAPPFSLPGPALSFHVPGPAPSFAGERTLAGKVPPDGEAPRAEPAGGRGGAGGEQTRAPGQADPGWPGRFAQVLAETLAGSRPPRQIERWTTQQVRHRIQRLGPQLSSAQRPRVRRVVTFRPASDVLEMTVIVGFGTRVRALAVRLERGPAPADDTPAAPRWLCTAVEAA